ncbi:MAG: MlaD family protein [Pseudomonadota bacterium]
MESDSHALKTGLFVVLASVLLTGAVLLFGDRQPPSVPYLVETRQSIEGLDVRSRVYYKGVEVGTVREIGFVPGNYDRVRILIDVLADVPLGENTYAQLKLRGITVEYDLTLYNDGSLGNRLASSEERPALIPLRLQVVERLTDAVESALGEFEALARNLKTLSGEENRARIESILANAEIAVTRFIALEDQLESSLADLPASLERLPPALESFTAAMDQIGGAADSVTTQTAGLDELITTMTGATRSLDRLLLAMQGGTLAEVEETLETLRLTLDQLADLAQTIQRDPQSLLLGSPKPSYGPGEEDGP